VYRFPENTDVGFLCERELVQVAVGAYEVQLHFDKDVSISIQGHCQIDDRVYAPGSVAGVHLIGLLGKIVNSARVVDNRHLRLDLKDGSSLIVLEDEAPYESYSVVGPEGVIVV
jgi:hypothetical protein